MGCLLGSFGPLLLSSGLGVTVNEPAWNLLSAQHLVEILLVLTAGQVGVAGQALLLPRFEPGAVLPHLGETRSRSPMSFSSVEMRLLLPALGPSSSQYTRKPPPAK